MPTLSTGGSVSSRTFTVQQLENALMAMPSSQRLQVRKFIRTIDNRTDMGYYAAMDFVANLGLFLEKKVSSVCETLP